jgi:endoplasmic reticulum resident protein 44
MTLFLSKLGSFLFLVQLLANVKGDVVSLNNGNFNDEVSKVELVFVNYYANWCRYSQMLQPIFEELGTSLFEKLPEAVGKVVLGKVDCDAEAGVCQSNSVSKYPTLKVYKFGTMSKKEYRGARTVDAFVEFLKEQLLSSLKVQKSLMELTNAFVGQKKRALIGYFSDEESQNFKIFSKLASIMRDTCEFYSGVGPEFEAKLEPNRAGSLYYKDVDSYEKNDLPYNGDLSHYESLYGWASDVCTQTVREITFENAEELTEEGLPFLILFHKSEDSASVKLFEAEVKSQLVHVKNTINAVYADGLKFSHPLNHLGKSSGDLPLLAIDSFRHMYLFPKSFNEMSQNQNLLNFVQDLHSGKLHREFHNGPDPTEAPAAKAIETDKTDPHIPIQNANVKIDQGFKRSTPPESVFAKLQPSRDRYSLKIDGEL